MMMDDDEPSATSQTSASLLQDRPIMVTSNILPGPSTEDSQATLSDHRGPIFMPAQPMVPMPRERTIRPREFKGDASWRSYQNHFNRVAEINGWTTDLKKTHLWINLSGTAIDYVDRLPDERTYTYEDLCEALDQRFGSERLSTIFRAELDHRVRRPEESLSALGQDIWRLTPLAYPDFAMNAIGEIAKEKFVKALPDPSLRLQIHHARPGTMEEAMEFAVHHEAWTTAETAHNPNPGKARGSAADEALMQMLKEMKNEIQEIKGKQELVKKDRKDIVCYNCNGKGHIARFCQAPKRKEAEN